jgi:glyoxylase-like metal-dependent hydrolase (beta-lactamase superfamily II)
LHGPAPVLVDPGFGSEVPDLMKRLAANSVRPEELALVVNTHYPSDHVGGNYALQNEYELAPKRSHPVCDGSTWRPVRHVASLAGSPIAVVTRR